MTDPQRYPVETARKKIADILDGTQFRGEIAEITRRDKRAGYLIPPEWYDEAVEALAEKRRKAVGSPPPAVATPRVQVSTAVPPEPSPEAEPGAEATATAPLPELSPREIHKAIKRAMSHATPDQRERLNRTAKVSEQLGRDAHGEVLKAAFEMGLLTHDEPTATDEESTEERPVSSEETSG